MARNRPRDGPSILRFAPHSDERRGQTRFNLECAADIMATATILKKDNVQQALSRALDAGEGLLRLTPTWVPRSFLHPGKRIKLAPQDYYAYGANRGGIDERWFASTTEAANENRTPDEGLSYVAVEGERFTLLDAVAEA